MKLLTRDEFKQAVFARDGFSCVICGESAEDAHHILERRLWPDGGYYLDNGASLCSQCHLRAEQTLISVEEIRRKAGIVNVVVPFHLDKNLTYTKWGDIVLPNGTRNGGELFFEEGVQRILQSASVLELYTPYIKYPRTPHFSWSKGATSDDKVIKNLSLFEKEIVMTVKMDGENTTLYRDYIHARSIDGKSHVSQNWVRNFHASIKHDIPQNWRFCGENLFAKHSLKYDSLPSYFNLFSVWNEKNECLSWDETLEWAELLGMSVVPTIFRGLWVHNPFSIHFLWTSGYNENENEGYVIRTTDSFSYAQFGEKVAKYVRPNHVTTSTHWKQGLIESNELITPILKAR